ncbi:uncharacterized protein LOC132795598 [Drosophila nasuta]|uniref:uncharacterized protein LOC132795598 n=1 Tax=Drosophila nasuta TaxID=42062 RepID=UPI00295E8F7C|nr:uncharacterized protein LOC132795598 [Drosophila nasuta]
MEQYITIEDMEMMPVFTDLQMLQDDQQLVFNDQQQVVYQTAGPATAIPQQGINIHSYNNRLVYTTSPQEQQQQQQHVLRNVKQQQQQQLQLQAQTAQTWCRPSADTEDASAPATTSGAATIIGGNYRPIGTLAISWQNTAAAVAAGGSATFAPCTGNMHGRGMAAIWGRMTRSRRQVAEVETVLLLSSEDEAEQDNDSAVNKSNGNTACNPMLPDINEKVSNNTSKLITMYMFIYCAILS